MNYEELKQTMIRLINEDELSLSQLEYVLEFIQGNGYVEDGEDYQFDDYDTN